MVQSLDVVVVNEAAPSPDVAAVAVDAAAATRPSSASHGRDGLCRCRRRVRRERVWYKQPLPLHTQLLGFLALFVVGVFTLAAALLLTNERMPDPRKVSPLPDLLFELFDKVAWLEPVVDMCIGVLNATAIFIAMKMYLLERQQRGLAPLALPTTSRLGGVARVVNAVLLRVVDSGKRPFPVPGVTVIAMIRFVTTYLVMVLYRSVVIIMTSFPPTDNACQHPRKIEHPLWNMVLTVVTFGGASIHCGDLMFSGHTIILTLGFLVLWNYGTYLHAWAFRVMGTTVLLFSFYCIIASRSHYTDDVVVALFSTVVTFIAIPHRRRGAPWQLQLCIRWCMYIPSCSRYNAHIDDPAARYDYDDDEGDEGDSDGAAARCNGCDNNNSSNGDGKDANKSNDGATHHHNSKTNSNDDHDNDGQHVAVLVDGGDGDDGRRRNGKPHIAPTPTTTTTTTTTTAGATPTHV